MILTVDIGEDRTVIPRCCECGRVIGDYHDPDCKIRSGYVLLVTAYHCEEVKNEAGASDSSG